MMIGHFRTLLFLVSEAKIQPYLCLKSVVQDIQPAPGQEVKDKRDWQFQGALGLTYEGKMLLENSFKSLKWPVRLNLSVLVYDSELHAIPCCEGPDSF